MTALSLYLSETRIGPSKMPTGSEAYALHVGVCRSMIRAVRHPKVAIVYSLSKRSEIVTIDGEPFLIHDRYLGQTLNTLTRILYWAQSPKPGEHIFFRTLAEEALLRGDSLGAMLGHRVAADLRRHWKVRQAVSSRDVWLEVLFQELFILAHEYCHLLMATLPEFAASRRRIGVLLADPEHDPPSDEARYAAFRRRYPSGGSFEAFTEMGHATQTFLRENQALLVDELACDDFALNVLLHHARAEGHPVGLVVRASFLSLRNIRALQYLRDATGPEGARRDVGGGLEARLLQARQHRLRSAYHVAANQAGYDVGEEDAVWRDLADLSDLHDRRIDEPILFKVIPRLATARNRLATTKPPGGIAECFNLAALTGWSPSSKLDYLLI